MATAAPTGALGSCSSFGVSGMAARAPARGARQRPPPARSRSRAHVLSNGELGRSSARQAWYGRRKARSVGRCDLSRRLHRAVREKSPNVLHSYLGMANIVAGRPALFPGTRVSGRARSNMDLSHYDWLSRFSTGLARVLSRTPDLVIINSRRFRVRCRSRIPAKR
jgi:hypothetical protein